MARYWIDGDKIHMEGDQPYGCYFEYIYEDDKLIVMPENYNEKDYVKTFTLHKAIEIQHIS